MIATMRSLDSGAVNMTYSWLKDFLRIDFREVSYDDFLGLMGVTTQIPSDPKFGP